MQDNITIVTKNDYKQPRDSHVWVNLRFFARKKDPRNFDEKQNAPINDIDHNEQADDKRKMMHSENN